MRENEKEIAEEVFSEEEDVPHEPPSFEGFHVVSASN